MTLRQVTKVPKNMMKIVKSKTDGRLDQILAEELGLTRNKAQEIIANKVLINGKEVTKNGTKIKSGDEISYNEPELPPDMTTKTKMDLQIVYEDQWLMIVNKPRGLVVHPAPGHYDDTLVNGLAYLVKEYGEYLDQGDTNSFVRPGIVHRIDKDTAGLLVVAKDDDTANLLTDMISRHEVKREYLAMVYGHPDHQTFKVDAPIGRSKYDRLKMAVDPINGKNAVTHFTVYNQYNKGALVRAELETGRTHQIRVHLAYAGYPVVGDEVYGRKNDKIATKGQCLHAFKLSFVHPWTMEEVVVYSPIDDYFKELLKWFCNN